MRVEQTPSVSVLMPVFNAERYVAQAIESILKQTFTNFEFIIINDGSTDNSFGIIHRYAQKDKRIRPVSRQNRGLVYTLNEGIGLVETPLVARMDADDVAAPTRLQIQKNFMDSHPEVLCVGGRYRLIDEKGRFLHTADVKTGKEVAEVALSGSTSICHPTAVIRTWALRKVGGYAQDDWPAEDLALWLKLSEFGELDNVPQVVLDYRAHEVSISSKFHGLQLQKMRQISRDACARRGVNYSLLTAPVRASRGGLTKFDQTLIHGWWAFHSGERMTAFIYGLKALGCYPFRDGGWRLAVCAILKHPRK